MRITSAKLASIGLALATCAAATAAVAGNVSHNVVFIYSYVGTTYFSGSLTGVRYSTDGVQEIGCEVNSYTNSAPQASCWARNAANSYVACWSTEPNLVATARSVTPASYISVSFNTASGTNGGQCSDITVSNSSDILP
jgi:hypothetical protein